MKNKTVMHAKLFKLTEQDQAFPWLTGRQKSVTYF